MPTHDNGMEDGGRCVFLTNQGQLNEKLRAFFHQVGRLPTAFYSVNALFSNCWRHVASLDAMVMLFVNMSPPAASFLLEAI